MHASRLVELAAIVASQHRLLCQQAVGADFWAADQFWVLCRARVNEWMRSLHRSETLNPHQDDFDPTTFWQYTRPVIEEVLLSEVCTRLWCAVLSTIEQQRHPGELDPIARSVFVSNLEARRRALRLILFAKGLPNISTSSLNTMRLTCEAWTDYLLAELPTVSLSQQFGFDRLRIQRIHQSLRQHEHQTSSAVRQRSRTVAMQYYLATCPLSPAGCLELNSEIAAVILSCLPNAAFDGSGTQQIDFPVATDVLSVDILSDLYGTVGSTRFDLRSGLKDNS